MRYYQIASRIGIYAVDLGIDKTGDMILVRLTVVFVNN